MEYKILIVEDDALIAEDTKLMLHDMGLNPIGKAFNAEKALCLIEEHKPDLVLLDIEIEGHVDGIMLAERINSQFQIPFIYLTSYYDEKTLIRAGETNPMAYVLKPFDERDIKVAIEMALYKFHRKSSETNGLIDQKIFVKEKGTLKPICLEEVHYFQSYDNYCFIYLKESKHLVLQKLKDFYSKYYSMGFLQIHRSYVVNFRHITQITEDHVYLNNYKIPIGKTYRKAFIEMLTVV